MWVITTGQLYWIMCVCTHDCVCIIADVCVCHSLIVMYCCHVFHQQFCQTVVPLRSFQSSLLQFCPVIYLHVFSFSHWSPPLFLLTWPLPVYLLSILPPISNPSSHPLFILCLLCSPLLLLHLFLSLCHPPVVQPLTLLSPSPSLFPLIFLSLHWLSSPSLINLHPPSCLPYSIPFILPSLITLFFSTPPLHLYILLLYSFHLLLIPTHLTFLFIFLRFLPHPTQLHHSLPSSLFALHPCPLSYLPPSSCFLVSLMEAE